MIQDDVLTEIMQDTQMEEILSKKIILWLNPPAAAYFDRCCESSSLSGTYFAIGYFCE